MKYVATIGLEIHCSVKSNTKMFSPALNGYNEMPNTNVNEIDLAFPGTLPQVNMEGVKKAIKMALALNCEVPKYFMFVEEFPMNAAGKILKYKMREESAEKLGLKR